MMLSLVLAFTTLAQVRAPCGLSPERPCYVKSISEVHEAAVSIPAWGTVVYRCEESGCSFFYEMLPQPRMTCASCAEQCSTCQHDHVTAALDVFTAFASLSSLLLAVVFTMTRLDRIVGAWRRAEIRRRWWIRPLRWMLATAVQCAFVVGLAYLSKAMGW